LFQAVLFTFGHLYYIHTLPITFWIIVPVGSLVLGWLVWRSRTIASSMIAHGMMNATGYFFGYLMAMFRLG
jgi:membrane protease YdiL (CAAX protease family)